MSFSREDWIIRDCDGKDFKCRMLWSGRRKNEVKLGRGWKSFCQAHNLKEGDVVKFSLDEDEINLLNVSVEPKP